MEAEEKFDLISMAQGLKWLMRQLYTKVAKAETSTPLTSFILLLLFISLLFFGLF